MRFGSVQATNRLVPLCMQCWLNHLPLELRHVCLRGYQTPLHQMQPHRPVRSCTPFPLGVSDLRAIETWRGALTSCRSKGSQQQGQLVFARTAHTLEQSVQLAGPLAAQHDSPLPQPSHQGSHQVWKDSLKHVSLHTAGAASVWVGQT